MNIQAKLQQLEKHGDSRDFIEAFSCGAHWANAQKAAEIAELLDILQTCIADIGASKSLAAAQKMREILKKYGK